MNCENVPQKGSKLNSASRLAITITVTLLVVILFLLAIVIPVSISNYERDVYSALEDYYELSVNMDDYVDSTKVGLIIRPNISHTISSEKFSLIEGEDKKSIVSQDTLWEIYDLFNTQEIALGCSLNVKFISEDKTTVFAHLVKFDEETMYCLYTTASAFGANPLYSEIFYVFFIGLSVTIIACISFGIIIYKNSKDIQKVNDFLANYSNDYSLPTGTSKDILMLVENFKNYRRSLLQKDIEKQQLFQNISHELKTPITTIKMYAEGMQDGIYKNDDISQSAGVIIDETNNLLTKVSKIMQINKLSYLEATKKNSLNTEKINLSELLFIVLNTYNDRAPDVKFNCKLERIEFRGTEEVWKTIFENIFDNNIRHGAKEITISLDEEFLIIENDGELLDEKISAKIYEPFKKGAKGNTGLGVSIITRSLSLYDYNLKIQNSEKGVVYFISDNHAERAKVKA